MKRKPFSIVFPLLQIVTGLILLVTILTFIALFQSPFEQKIEVFSAEKLRSGHRGNTSNFYLYYTDSDSSVIESEGDRKWLRIKLYNEEIYTGFGFDRTVDVPEESVLVIKWRSSTPNISLQVDLVDGSAYRTGRGLGEVFSFSSITPWQLWEETQIPLSKFVRNSAQSPDRPNDGYLDSKGINSVQVLTSPGNDIVLDIEEVYFYWTKSKSVSLFFFPVIWLMGLGLWIRGFLINRITLEAEAGFARILISRLIFIGSAILLLYLETFYLQNKHLFKLLAFTGIFAFFAFLETYLPKKWHSYQPFAIRYVLIFLLVSILVPFSDIFILSLLLLMSFVPLINIESRRMFFIVNSIGFLGIFANHLIYDGISGGYKAVVFSMVSLFSVVIMEFSRLRTTKKQFSLTTILYEGVFANSTDGILILDQKRQISKSNKGIIILLGYVNSELVETQFDSYVFADDVESLNSLFEENLQNTERRELRMIHKDGQVKTVVLSRQAIIRNESIIGFLILARDITERKKYEQELRMANETLSQIAVEDSLTRIANRRKFDEMYDQEWRRTRRNEFPLTVMMVDVDLFKLYNDTYGHQQGDLCLMKVAQTIDESVKRSTDVAARYGGEEFVILLSEISSDKALMFAQSLCKKIEELKIPHKGSNVSDYVTVSIGVATIIPSKEISPISLIKRADQGLYMAKQAGKNRALMSDH